MQLNSRKDLVVWSRSETLLISEKMSRYRSLDLLALLFLTPKTWRQDLKIRIYGIHLMKYQYDSLVRPEGARRLMMRTVKPSFLSASLNSKTPSPEVMSPAVKLSFNLSALAP